MRKHKGGEYKMKEDKKISAKKNAVRGRIFAFAAVFAAVAVLCSVFIIRAKAYNKNVDNEDSVSSPDKTLISTAEKEREQQKETQVKPEQTESSEKLTAEYMLRFEGVDIAGSDKKGKVYFRELTGAGGGTSELSLWADGEEIWTSDEHMPVSAAHVGQTSYYAVRVGGKNYIMEYTPYIGQGTDTAYYEIFSVDMDGNEKVIDKDIIGFIFMKKSSGEGYFPVKYMLDFAEKVKGYIDNGSLLVSTVSGTFEYDNSADKTNPVFPYLKFIYPWVYEQAASQKLDLDGFSSLEEVLEELEKGLRVVPEDWDAQIDVMKKWIEECNA